MDNTVLTETDLELYEVKLELKPIITKVSRLSMTEEDEYLWVRDSRMVGEQAYTLTPGTISEHKMKAGDLVCVNVQVLYPNPRMVEQVEDNYNKAEDIADYRADGIRAGMIERGEV